jgi:branched-subunit amino acid ABC-type transport system permease component
VAKAPGNMNALSGLGRLTEVRQRLTFVLMALVLLVRPSGLYGEAVA